MMRRLRLAPLLAAAFVLLALAACERTGGASGPYIGIGGGLNRAAP